MGFSALTLLVGCRPVKNDLLQTLPILDYVENKAGLYGRNSRDRINYWQLNF